MFNQYDLVNQLEKTPTHISIFELLHISPPHKEIIDKALQETLIPTDLLMDQFQAMVGYISSPLYLMFTNLDDTSPKEPHNAPLHIEAFIHKYCIK